MTTLNPLGKFCCWLLSTICLTACDFNQRPSECDFCILYTTDTHSYVLPYDFCRDTVTSCLCNFASLVKEQRAIYGDHCLVFDNGNKLSGGPTAFYYKFADTITEPICYRAERFIQYDGINIGIDDIEIPECLQPTRHNPLLQPVTLCANLINRKTGKPLENNQPYAIYERDGIRIAVLGMMPTTTGEWMPHDLWQQYDTEDMIDCAKKWMKEIQEKAKPDIVIGLFSCNKDYNRPDIDCDIDTYKNPQGGIPAAIRVPGFDLVLLGNSTENYTGKVTNDEGQTVYILQAGTLCQKAGLIRLHLSKNKDGYYNKRFFTTLIDLKQYEVNPVMSHHFQDAQDSIYIWFNKPIGYLKDYILGNKGIYGPDYYRDMINSVQLWFTKADISISSVIITRDSIPAGSVSMKEVFDIYPYQHKLQTITMTGEEVRRYLEWGYQGQFETMSSPQDPLLRLEKDPYNHVVYNAKGQPTLYRKPNCFVSAGGIHYTVDVSKPIGERVNITSWSNGEPFDPRGVYRVAINSEQLKDNGYFITKGLNWDRETLALHAVPTPHNSLRKIIYDYFQEKDTLHIKYRHDWDIIPEDFWEEAKMREQRTLDAIW